MKNKAGECKAPKAIPKDFLISLRVEKNEHEILIVVLSYFFLFHA